MTGTLTIILWLESFDARLDKMEESLERLLEYQNNDKELKRLAQILSKSTKDLKTAVNSAAVSNSVPLADSTFSLKGATMNPILEQLRRQVEATVGVQNSAIALSNGIAARIQAAVDKALEGGVTAEQMAGVQAEIDALKASSEQLATAVETNA